MKRVDPLIPLSMIVIGLITGTVAKILFLYFLTTKYNNIFTLDGDWFVRGSYLVEFLFRSRGGAAFWGSVCMVLLGLGSLKCGRRRGLTGLPPR